MNTLYIKKNNTSRGELTRRTIAYVDGYNLYGGLIDPHNKLPGDSSKQPLRKYLWLKLDSFITSYLPPLHELVCIKYFSAPIRGDVERQKRQNAYIKALGTIECLSIFMGEMLPATHGYKEKKTDVEMALNMYSDALNGACDSILLLSADTDQVATINWIRKLNKDIEILVLFPPSRYSKELHQLADHSYKIRYKKLAKYQFPSIIQSEGFTISKPESWK